MSTLDINNYIVEDEPEEGKLYLKLFHGRKNPEEELNDWGEDGPLIGPLKWCHTTYSSTIRLGFEDGNEEIYVSENDNLHLTGDLLHLNGVYYGDWMIQLHE